MNRFDEMAENWDDDPQKVKRAKSVADQIRRYVPLTRQMRAMEFGCGTGLLSFALKDDLGYITLVDTSRGMLDVLQRKIKAGGVKNMSPLHLDLAAGDEIPQPFDFIYTMMALHHVQSPERVLAVFSKALKEGGYLAIAELEKGGGGFHGSDFDGHDGFSKEELAAMAQAEGLTTERFCDCFVIDREMDGTREHFNVFLLLSRKR